MIRIAHIITTVSTGGAETMLCKLLAATDRGRFSPEVFSLAEVGATGMRITRDLGIPVFSLKPTPGRTSVSAAVRLLAQLRRSRPHIVQTWMYHANLMGGIAGRALGKPVIWNIRRGSLAHLKRRTLWVSRACSAVSSVLPARIVCCSSDSLERHAAVGYARASMTVIPNGFDLLQFRPDPTLRQSLRGELGIGPETPLIGLVARFDPAKDHETFLRSAALIHAECPGARFLLCGKDIDSGNWQLSKWIETLGLMDGCFRLGVRDDVPRILAGLDVLVSSSACEGFPNVLGEAMACGVPCVATDVGDSGMVVGNTGRLAPPGDASALAVGCIDLIDMGAHGRAELGAAARLRIETHFSMAAVAAQYQDLYERVFYEKVLETCAA
jgi:glycosyltransferase involved in cell wall biosynthesis